MQLLYDAPDLEESTKKDTRVIYLEAIAIYHITYDYARDILARDIAAGSAPYGEDAGVKKCAFVWKVAGSALYSFLAWGSVGSTENSKPITIVPSMLKELLK